MTLSTFVASITFTAPSGLIGRRQFMVDGATEVEAAQEAHLIGTRKFGAEVDVLGLSFVKTTDYTGCICSVAF